MLSVSYPLICLLLLTLLIASRVSSSHLLSDDVQNPENILNIACDGELQKAYNVVHSVALADMNAEQLHIKSALTYILFGDVTESVRLHRLAKAAAPTLMPPLARLHVIDQRFCGGLGDIFYSGAVVIKMLVDANASVSSLPVATAPGAVTAATAAAVIGTETERLAGLVSESVLVPVAVDEMLSGHRTMITLCSDSGLNDAAQMHLTRSHALAPRDLSLYMRQALMVPPVYDSFCHILQTRRAQFWALQDLLNTHTKTARLVSMGKAPASDLLLLPVDEFSLMPNFYWIYQGLSDRPLLELLASAYELTVPALMETTLKISGPESNAEPQTPTPIPTSTRIPSSTTPSISKQPLRVGFVSSHLKRTHSICKLFCDVITTVADRLGKKSRVFLFVRSEDPGGGAEKELAASARHSNVIPVRVGNFLLNNRAEVTGRRVDVLIFLDYGLDPSTRMWAASRLAPLQLVTWGHPSTSGLSTLDYYLLSERFYHSDLYSSTACQRPLRVGRDRDRDNDGDNNDYDDGVSIDSSSSFYQAALRVCCNSDSGGGSDDAAAVASSSQKEMRRNKMAELIVSGATGEQGEGDCNNNHHTTHYSSITTNNSTSTSSCASGLNNSKNTNTSKVCGPQERFTEQVLLTDSLGFSFRRPLLDHLLPAVANADNINTVKGDAVATGAGVGVFAGVMTGLGRSADAASSAGADPSVLAAAAAVAGSIGNCSHSCCSSHVKRIGIFGSCSNDISCNNNTLNVDSVLLQSYISYSNQLTTRSPAYYQGLLSAADTLKSPQLRSLIRLRLEKPGVRLLLCPQHLPKMHPLFDRALALTLQRVPDAVLVLLSGKQGQWRLALKRRLEAALRNDENGKSSSSSAGGSSAGGDSRIGLEDIASRVVWLEGMSPSEYVMLLAAGDLMLDPFPFGGGVTALEALAVATPVVTLPSLQNVPALATGMLAALQTETRRLGLGADTEASLVGAIATSVENYSEAVVRLLMSDIQTEQQQQQRERPHQLLVDRTETEREDTSPSPSSSLWQLRKAVAQTAHVLFNDVRSGQELAVLLRKLVRDMI